jgi:hypothetical protein
MNLVVAGSLVDHPSDEDLSPGTPVGSPGSTLGSPKAGGIQGAEIPVLG